MELDARKIKILLGIIQTYLETGEPVGSRTISRFPDLKLSSATIRNEMSDLEEMGYIFQPHTSAGRIPTDKGYRFYVDHMMSEKQEAVVREQEMMVKKVDRLEQILKQVVRMLATNTNYASLITAPKGRRSKMKFVQVSMVEPGKFLAVMMLENNAVKTKVVHTDETLTETEIVKLNLLLNTYLQGLSLQEINMDLIYTMKQQCEEHRVILEELIDAVVDAIREEDDTQIYTSGTTNLLKYPELGDREKTGQLLLALEEGEGLTELMNTEDGDRSRGIQVYIGSESPVQSMQDCSVVTATYELEEGVQGTIGIVGPKRMDYRKVVENLETVMSQLDTIFKKDQSDPSSGNKES